MTTPKINWPGHKDFAFTIFDDTDRATLNNIKPVYDYLIKLGLKTTKSVWPLNGKTDSDQGDSCQNPDYLKWLLQLKDLDFEIAYHMPRCHSSHRDYAKLAIETFYDNFKHYPQSYANHSLNQDSIYWSYNRLTGFNKAIYNMLTKFRYFKYYQGENEKSPFFWGDLCKNHIKYMRNFVYSDINTLKACPYMPYHDPAKPFANLWFASTEGNTVKSFNKAVSKSNIDQLEKEKGACIMYTHFAFGFYKNGKLNSNFQGLMEYISKKNGWFVPVSTLLDFLLKQKKNAEITYFQRKRMEYKWLLNKILIGST